VLHKSWAWEAGDLTASILNELGATLDDTAVRMILDWEGAQTSIFG
jgi:hypothetical protein